MNTWHLQNNSDFGQDLLEALSQELVYNSRLEATREVDDQAYNGSESSEEAFLFCLVEGVDKSLHAALNTHQSELFVVKSLNRSNHADETIELAQSV